MIYTSYYGNLKKLKNSGHKIEPISVSRITPVGIHIFTIEELFPSKELLNWWKNSNQTESDKQKYIEIYNKQLSQLNAKKIEQKLYQYSCKKDVVLLCYEKPADFCHRHLIAKWLQNNGISVEEWKNEQN